jgi:hypothetical protein
MIRGTTPTLGAICDMDLSAFKNICTVWQDDIAYEITPTVTSLDSGCMIYATLTQEQTLSFTPNKQYNAQMRSIDANGFCVASAEFSNWVYDVHKDGMIYYGTSTVSLGSLFSAGSTNADENTAPDAEEETAEEETAEETTEDAPAEEGQSEEPIPEEPGEEEENEVIEQGV